MGIKRLMISIGKTQFTEWLEECLKHYPDGQSLVIEKMEQETDNTLESCRSRISTIFRIIKENRIEEACDEVMNSTHSIITDKIKLKAKNLKKYAHKK